NNASHDARWAAREEARSRTREARTKENVMNPTRRTTPSRRRSALRRSALRAGVSMSVLLAIGACSPEQPAADAQQTPAEPTEPTARELAVRLVEEMGGRDALESVDVVVRQGSGTRTRVGQVAETGGEDPTGQIENVTETIDLADGRAAFDYDVRSGGFTQHRTEVFTAI